MAVRPGMDETKNAANAARRQKEKEMSDLQDRVLRSLFPAEGSTAIDVKFSNGGCDGVSSIDLLRQIDEANAQIAAGTATLIEDIDADLTEHA